MIKKLKYQWLLEREGITTTCPKDYIEGKMIAFRWVFEPTNNELNFLPKIVYDEKKGTPQRFNAEVRELRCSCCALSMFTTKETAKQKFTSIPKRARELLGYTHIAEGEINKEVGVYNINNKTKHLDFFEYEKVELNLVFKIVDTL